MVWKNGKLKIHGLAADILSMIHDSMCCFGVVPRVLGQHHPTVSGLLDVHLRMSPRTEAVFFLSQLV